MILSSAEIETALTALRHRMRYLGTILQRDRRGTHPLMVADRQMTERRYDECAALERRFTASQMGLDDTQT